MREVDFLRLMRPCCARSVCWNRCSVVNDQLLLFLFLFLYLGFFLRMITRCTPQVSVGFCVPFSYVCCGCKESTQKEKWHARAPNPNLWVIVSTVRQSCVVWFSEVWAGGCATLQSNLADCVRSSFLPFRKAVMANPKKRRPYPWCAFMCWRLQGVPTTTDGGGARGEEGVPGATVAAHGDLEGVAGVSQCVRRP